MPNRPAAAIALLALAFLAGCSSKPAEIDTAETVPDPAVVKPATPGTAPPVTPPSTPAPAPEATAPPKE